jgi:3-oxoacyl-[acyl-carrier-protein] synthase-3
MSENAVTKSQATNEPSCFIASRITGTGISVPPKVIGNDHFASYLETSDEWIQERTGIEERRYTEPDVSASDLAEPACLDAIKAAGLTVDDIDGIICGTVTPDNLFPSTACFIQGKLGIKNGFALDVNAVCCGFVYALSTADAYIRAGMASNILVIGVDLYSRIIDPNDRGTCILFGDGAGAVVLSRNSDKPSAFGQPCGEQGSMLSTSGIYGAELHADGSQADILCVPQGTANNVTVESLQEGKHFLHMAGREVFKHAVRSLVQVTNSVLEDAGLSVGDVDHFVSHQANKRILLSMAKQLKVSEERIPMNLQKYGNTSAATIPMLLAECVAEGRIKKGDLVLLSAVGGGLSWGAVLLRW